MIQRDMPTIDAAINEESFDWLHDNAPILANAVAEEVKRGASATDVRRHVMVKTYRPALALRCEQAAAYLGSVNGDQT